MKSALLLLCLLLGFGATVRAEDKNSATSGSVDERVKQLLLKLPPAADLGEQNGPSWQDKNGAGFCLNHMAGIARREFVPLGAAAVPALLQHIEHDDVKIRCIVIGALNQITQVQPWGLSLSDMTDEKSEGRTRLARQITEWHARASGAYAQPDFKWSYYTRPAKSAFRQAFSVIDAHGDVLFSDGSVGIFFSDKAHALALFDPATETLEYRTEAPGKRFHVLNVIALPNDRALITGSHQSWIYAHKTHSFTPVQDPGYCGGNISLSAVTLADGRVLFSGGRRDRDPSDACVIFDPKTDTFEAAGKLQLARERHTATLLADGKVLIAGGNSADQLSGFDSLELYDPVAHTSLLLDVQMACPRFLHDAVRLKDGMVLIVGGIPWKAGGKSRGSGTASAELFDPATRKLIRLPDMALERGDGTCAVLLRSGRVAILAGQDKSRLIEIYCPKERIFILADQLMQDPRRLFNTRPVLLPNGELLLSGGRTGSSAEMLSSIEFFGEKSIGANPPAGKGLPANANLAPQWTLTVFEKDKPLENFSFPLDQNTRTLEFLDQYSPRKSELRLVLRFPLLYLQGRQGQILNDVGLSRFPSVQMGPVLSNAAK